MAARYRRIPDGPPRLVNIDRRTGQVLPLQKKADGNYQEVPRSTYNRMLSQYRKLHQAYPDYSWREYLDEWATGQIRPYSQEPERRTPESIGRRPGEGRYVLYTTAQLGEAARERMHHDYGGIDSITMQIEPGQPETFQNPNRFAIDDNIDALIAADNRAALIYIITASPEEIKKAQSTAGNMYNRWLKGEGPIPEAWYLFYHGDSFSIIAAAGGF